MAKICVILPAAGRSTRFGDPKQKKIYSELEGRAVWLRAVEPFVNRDDVEQMILVIAAEDRELFDRRYKASVAFMNIEVIEGGAERSDSIAQALDRVKPGCDYVAIHDAARPCLTVDQVDAVFKAAEEHGAALLAIPASDTLKQVGDDRMTLGTVNRRGVYLAQTPQVFRKDWLLAAYADREKLGAAVTDDTQLVEALGHRCAVVDGSSFNLKITTKADLLLASAILKSKPASCPSRSQHPFADEMEQWGELPRLKPSDVFGS